MDEARDRCDYNFAASWDTDTYRVVAELCIPPSKMRHRLTQAFLVLDVHFGINKLKLLDFAWYVPADGNNVFGKILFTFAKVIVGIVYT